MSSDGWIEMGSNQQRYVMCSWFLLVVYLVLSLLMGGGVCEGEVERSPACSGFSESEGGMGGWTLGGVDELLRDDEEPLRDTQEVSITRTPILQRGRHTANQIPHTF